MNSNRRRNQNGAALTMVIIFVLFCVIIGGALLLSAQVNIRQGLALQEMDTHYYAAESAAQTAGQAFISEFKKLAADDADPTSGGSMANSLSGGIFYERLPLGANEDAAISAFTDRIKNELRALFDAVVDTWDEDAPFNSLRIVKDELSFEVGDVIIGISDDYLTIGGSPYIYLNDAVINVSATSAGRTVTLSYNCGGGVMRSISTAGEADWDEEATSASFDDMNGRFVATDKNASYDTYVGMLENLVNDAADYASPLASREALEEDIRDVLAENEKYGGIYTLYSIDDEENDAEYILMNIAEFDVRDAFGVCLYKSDPLAPTLTITGPAVVYDLDYLYVEGNLTIIGNVEFPNTKEIFVTGNLTIGTPSGVTTITGNPEPNLEAGVIIVGTNFLVGGKMDVYNNYNSNPQPYAPTKLYHCRFMVNNNITIYSRADGLYESNSVHISYNGSIDVAPGLANNAKHQIGNEKYAPQFYARNNLHIHLNANTYSYGIFVALGEFGRTGNSSVNLYGFGFGKSISLSNTIKSENLLVTSDAYTKHLMDYGSIVYGIHRTGKTPELVGVYFIFTSNNITSIREQ